MNSRLDVWKEASVNRSNRPILQEDEHNLYIRDSIGLYQGKLKIMNRQNGRIYLTNMRVIYVDNKDLVMSMAVDLKDVSGSEVIEGFLRSSPKVKLFIKDTDVQPLKDKHNDGNQDKLVLNWTCVICSFNNHLAINTNLDTNFPKCGSCGIKPSRELIHGALERAPSEISTTETPKDTGTNTTLRDDQCPKCTFINHPSMKYCELCGSELKSSISKRLQQKLQIKGNADQLSPTSNNMNIVLESNSEVYSNNKPYIKLSFRKNGESQFNKLLIEAIDKLKWNLLVNKGSVNERGSKLQEQRKSSISTIKGGGIHGLEQIGEQQRKKNELVLSTSLEDLEQLMYKAQDLIKLSRSFSKLVKSNNNINRIIPPLNIKKTSNLYHQELSRHISEYLTNFQLTKSSSMVTSQDLYANYNRYLISTQGFGTELIAPNDFSKSLELFDNLNLPITLKHYERSGLVVVCYRTHNNYSEFILKFLEEQEKSFFYNKLKSEILMGINELESDEDGYIEEKYKYFKGSTIPEICDDLGWSYGITIEEIEKCIETGLIVIDQTILGSFYFMNHFIDMLIPNEDTEELREKIKQEIITEQENITESLHRLSFPETMESVDSLIPYVKKGDHQNFDVQEYWKSDSLNDLQGLEFN